MVATLDKPASYFKFNYAWLEEDEFKDLVKSMWILYDYSRPTSTTIQFLNNLKWTKNSIISWAADRRKRRDL